MHRSRSAHVSATRAACAHARQSAGFTLIEVLVVIVIIGILVSAATLAISVLGRDRQSEDQMQRLWAVLGQAREEAELQGIDVGLFFCASGYEFLRFDRREQKWVTITDDRLFATRTLPEGLKLRVWIDGKEIVLKPDFPNREDEAEQKKWAAQVTVLSSGEISPFEVQIERDNAPALWRVVAQADNDLRIERREAEKEWALVAQTNPPPDEEEAKDRKSLRDRDRRKLSDARL
ncbi:MAG TPA: type II secretion system minor pseudopilin GspH [Steroidobacteraceae bacterium]|nr:type II secretion system minor pseudopilin GspH [Steroidobacteraceae bacterium]